MGFGSNLRALNFFIGGMLPDLFSCCMPSVNSFSHGFWWFWSACPLACLLTTSTPIEVVGLLSSVTYVLPVVCSRYFTSCTIYHYGNLVTRLWWTHPKFWNLVVFLLRPNTSLIHWPYFLLYTASSLIWKLYTLQTTTSPTLHSNCSQPTNFTEIPQINFTFTVIALGTVPSIILIVHRDAMETGDNFFLVH